MDLASLIEFYALCPSQADADEVGVAIALSAASAAAERYCGRSFTSAVVTEYYDGNGYPNLPLRRFPLTAVDSVYLDINGGYGQVPGSFAANTLLTLGTDYIWLANEGVLQLRTVRSAPFVWPLSGIGPGSSPWGWPGLTRHGTSWAGWPKSPGCVKVTYTGGYATIPDDLKTAVCSMASYMLIATDNGGLITTSSNYIDVSVGNGFLTEQLARGNVPALGSAREILDSYRDIKMARGVF